MSDNDATHPARLTSALEAQMEEHQPPKLAAAGSSPVECIAVAEAEEDEAQGCESCPSRCGSGRSPSLMLFYARVRAPGAAAPGVPPLSLMRWSSWKDAAPSRRRSRVRVPYASLWVASSSGRAPAS